MSVRVLVKLFTYLECFFTFVFVLGEEREADVGGCGARGGVRQGRGRGGAAARLGAARALLGAAVAALHQLQRRGVVVGVPRAGRGLAPAPAAAPTPRAALALARAARGPDLTVLRRQVQW